MTPSPRRPSTAWTSSPRRASSPVARHCWSSAASWITRRCAPTRSTLPTHWGTSELLSIPGLAHPLADEPGIEPAPQLPLAREVDAAWPRGSDATSALAQEADQRKDLGRPALGFPEPSSGAGGATPQRLSNLGITCDLVVLGLHRPVRTRALPGLPGQPGARENLQPGPSDEVSEKLLADAEARYQGEDAVEWTGTAPGGVAGGVPRVRGEAAAVPAQRRCAAAPGARRPAPINRLTDVYNAVSIATYYRSAARRGGVPRPAAADPATGAELFDTVAGGEPTTEHPEPGEIVWRDDLGITCRRWNWRQCVRTRLTTETTHGVFILDALGALPDAELEAATSAMVDVLRATSPDADITTRTLGPPRAQAGHKQEHVLFSGEPDHAGPGSAPCDSPRRGDDRRELLPAARTGAEAAGTRASPSPTASPTPRTPTAPPVHRGRQREFLEDKEFIETFILIAAMGAVTTTLRFTPFVLKLAVRPPVLVAKQAASIAALTGNRLTLGVGISPWPKRANSLLHSAVATGAVCRNQSRAAPDSRKASETKCLSQ